MRYSIGILTLLFLAGCQQAPDQLNVDLIYYNGVIWTGSADIPDARVVAVNEGKLIFVGDTLPPHISSDMNIDLSGKFVMSGFMDNHVHFMEGGCRISEC